MQDVHKTIISQYGNSPTMIQLIEFWDAYIDPHKDFDDFYRLIWDIRTAQGIGLDIWGRIVNISRFVELPPVKQYFGFGQATPEVTPFDEAPFYEKKSYDPQSNIYALPDRAYRRLILFKALANITPTNVPAVNALLMMFFAGRGNAWAIDGHDMTMEFRFDFPLEPYEQVIIDTQAALPRPAGVWIMGPDDRVFGFSECIGCTPFDDAIFYSRHNE